MEVTHTRQTNFYKFRIISKKQIIKVWEFEVGTAAYRKTDDVVHIEIIKCAVLHHSEQMITFASSQFPDACKVKPATNTTKVIRYRRDSVLTFACVYLGSLT